MQAYKLNATINESGQLIIQEPLNIAPGNTEPENPNVIQ